MIDISLPPGLALQPLGAMLHAGLIPRQTYRAALADMLIRHFRCARVRLWRLSGDPGQRVATCVAAHCNAQGPRPGGETLAEQAGDPYFEHLIACGVYVSNDTWADPKLTALQSRYRPPTGSRALLDASFAVNGRAFGVLCCEELERPRHWTLEEVTTLRRVAGRVSLQLTRAQALGAL